MRKKMNENEKQKRNEKKCRARNRRSTINKINSNIFEKEPNILISVRGQKRIFTLKYALSRACNYNVQWIYLRHPKNDNE